MKLMRAAIIVGIVSMLSACMNMPQLQDGQMVPAGHGVLVTTMHSNYKGYDNLLLAKLEFLFSKEGSRLLRHGMLVMERSNDLKVVTLPAGRYVWSRLQLGDLFMDFDERHGFEIAEGTVTYIGDIHCDIEFSGKALIGYNRASLSDLRIADRESEAKTKLIAEYPKLLTSYKYEKNISTFR